MALASSNLMVGQASTNGCCQHLCSQMESWLVGSCLSGRFSKISKWIWGAPFKLLSLHRDSEHVRFSMCPFKVEFLFPTALSHMQALLAFKARHSGSLSSLSRTSRLGSLMWSLDSWLLSENFFNCDYPSFCGSPLQGYGFWQYHISTPLTCLTVSFFIYLVV